VHASLTTTRGDADSDVAALAGETMLRWLGDIDGFEGLLMLQDDAETTQTLSFWRDRETAARHREARRRLRDSITTTVEVRVEATAEYDVVFARLGPRLAATDESGRA
jgi:heme-degrading monooxygenase HmoA